MNDEQLRAIVRDAVARHLGRQGGSAGAPVFPGSDSAGRHRPDAGPAPRVPDAGGAHRDAHAWQQHASHHLYVSLVNVDGACVIEPAVPCDHCGYCKSHGH